MVHLSCLCFYFATGLFSILISTGERTPVSARFQNVWSITSIGDSQFLFFYFTDRFIIDWSARMWVSVLQRFLYFHQGFNLQSVDWPYCAVAQQMRSMVAIQDDLSEWDTMKWRRQIETFGNSDVAVPASGPGGDIGQIWSAIFLIIISFGLLVWSKLWQ